MAAVKWEKSCLKVSGLNSHDKSASQLREKLMLPEL